jgi:pyruvate/2-oxoglutarate/acetoin dehydrogenase E1 component
VASSVPVVLRAPYGVFGAAGVLDLLASVPGLTVQASSMSDGGAALDALLDARAPAVLLESVSAEVGVLREGGHVLIVAAASEAGPAMAAAAALQADGIEATVLALGSLWPVPAEVSARLRNIGRLVVVTPPGESAWGRRVAAVGLDGAFLYLEAPLSVVEGRAGDIQQAARSAAQF